MKVTIKFFNDEKKFGFILGEDEKEVFVHESEMEEGMTVQKGDSVEYEVETGEKGLKAVKVKKA